MSLFPLITLKVKDSHISLYFARWGIFLLEVGVWLIHDGLSSVGTVTEANAVCIGVKKKN